jgi:hypothetical protein
MPQYTARDYMRKINQEFSDILPYTNFSNDINIPPRGAPGYSEIRTSIKNFYDEMYTNADRIRQEIAAETVRQALAAQAPPVDERKRRIREYVNVREFEEKEFFDNMGRAMSEEEFGQYLVGRTPAQILKDEEEEKKRKIVPEGKVRVSFETDYLQSPDLTKIVYTNDSREHRGWVIIGEYGEDGSRITGQRLTDREISDGFVDFLGVIPWDDWAIIPKEAEYMFVLPFESPKKYATVMMLSRTVSTTVDLTPEQYDYFNNELARVKDTYYAMLNTARYFNEFEFIVVEPETYDNGSVKYLKSTKPIITLPTQTTFGNLKSTPDRKKAPLLGVLSDDEKKIDLTNAINAIVGNTIPGLYKIEGTTYGDTTGNCVPFAITTEWKGKEWDLPEEQFYNAEWLQSYAEKNKLSLLIVDTDNNIIARNIGNHDIMNHKRALIAIVLENHLSIVTCPKLRKSLTERAKSQKDAKYEKANRYEDEDKDSEEEELAKLNKIKEEEKTSKQKDRIKELTKLIEQEKKDREMIVKDYDSRFDCYKIDELGVIMEEDGHANIYYHGDFPEAVGFIINNTVDKEKIPIIPRAYGKEKTVAMKKGKISAIKYRDHWIKKGNEDDGTKLFEKLLPTIHDNFYKHINPQMSVAELMKGVREFYLKNINGVLNDYTMKFLDSKATIEMCRPLVSAEDLDKEITVKRYELDEKNEKLISTDEVTSIASIIIFPLRTKVYATDISKAFQLAAVSGWFGDFARFSGCEIYMEYDGHAIEKNAFYYVESDTKHIFYRGNGPYEGNAVNAMINAKIIEPNNIKSYCKPEREFKQAEITNFVAYINEKFGPKEAKKIFNTTVGCMKPNLDKVYRQHCLTTDINVLHARMTKEGKKPHVETIPLGNDKCLWNISVKGDFAKYKTCHNVRMAIIDRLYCITLDIYQTLLKSGCIPFFIKTDCIYYLNENNLPDGLDAIEKKYRKLNPQLANLPEFATLKRIYCLQNYETEYAKGEQVYKELHFKAQNRRYDLPRPLPLEKPITRIEVEDGKNPEFIQTLMNKDGALIESPAGHGKTVVLSSLEEKFLRDEKKVLKCSFTNAVKLLIDGSTFHSAFRLSRSSNKFYKIEKNLRKVADEYDVILCDECSMITGDIYECLAYIKNYKPKIKIFLFGNWRQCKPVEPGRDIDYKTLGLLNCIVDWNHVKLTKNWRVKASEHAWADFLNQPDEAFFGTDTEESGYKKMYPSQALLEHVNINGVEKNEWPVNIAYTNKKCKEVNNERNLAIGVWMEESKLPFHVCVEKKERIILYNKLRLIGRVKVRENENQKYIEDALNDFSENICINADTGEFEQNELLPALEEEKIDEDFCEEKCGECCKCVANEEALIESRPGGLMYKNEHYVVESFDTNKNTFTVYTNDEFHELEKNKKRMTYKISDLFKFFKLGYCFTVHSVQGLTIKTPYEIHEFGKMCYFGMEVVYTAISRAEDPNQITIRTDRTIGMADNIDKKGKKEAEEAKKKAEKNKLKDQWEALGAEEQKRRTIINAELMDQYKSRKIKYDELKEKWQWVYVEKKSEKNKTPVNKVKVTVVAEGISSSLLDEEDGFSLPITKSANNTQHAPITVAVKVGSISDSILNEEDVFTVPSAPVIDLSPNIPSNVERFDYETLKFISENIKSLQHLLQIKDMSRADDLKNYLAAAQNIDGVGQINVNYFTASNGRAYAENGMSLQSMYKNVRACVAGEMYYDIDMVNTQPTIISAICKRHGIETPCLDYLIANRERVFAGLGVDDETAKKFIIAKLNGGRYENPDIIQTKWYVGFSKEIEDILNRFLVLFNSEVRSNGSKNRRGTVIANICHREEGKLLNIIKECLTATGMTNDYVLCFDGILVPKAALNAPMDQILRGIENIILTSTGIPMKLKNKPMETIPLERLKFEVMMYESMQNDDCMQMPSDEFIALMNKYRTV